MDTNREGPSTALHFEVPTRYPQSNRDLILAYVSAHAGNFADAGNGLQLIFHDEVLQAAEFGQVHAGWRFKHIVEDLAQAGCIGTERRHNAIW